MYPIGFSTGAIAKGDFRRGIELVRRLGCPAIELSALREVELAGLIDALPELDLAGFQHVSVHAPSSFRMLQERDAVSMLEKVAQRNIPIVLHPDASACLELWQAFGPLLMIENMDKRKSAGRSVAELAAIFDRLPQALLCFDIAHARQIDPTMNQAFMILRKFRDKLAQIHLSEVAADGRHTRLTIAAMFAYPRVRPLIPDHIPVIIESVLRESEMDDEMAFANEIWQARADRRTAI